MNDPSTPPVATLKPRKALPFFCQHPWVYDSAIQKISGSVSTGDEVIVRANDGQFIARGLINPNSKIRIRLYSWDESTPLDASFWKARIHDALQLRKKLFGDTPTEKTCRLVFSESDRLSGLTVDRFNDWLILQWTSAALESHKTEIVNALQEEVSPRGIWLRTEKGIKTLEGLDIEDGLIQGEEPPRRMTIEENSLRFHVDLIEGQKTGFYFDQRENRRAIHNLAAGAHVLDVCTYTGSFALNAASNPKCESVLAIDSSASALELAQTNAEENGLANKVTFQRSDAFDGMAELVEQGIKFDLVILDPPKLARTRGGLKRAVKAYIRLNSLAIQLLQPGGFLLTCSCSGHVSVTDFFEIIAQSSLEVARPVQILQEFGQAPDHPVISSCPETSYLKAFLCRAIG
ncbi:Ribosomal RNA large subunit methyltransferase I [Thalassoglobus neptunius]|uniref:Ribosomal RNA large subunit methyltransferase I n=1 Tax=Thalassoglobus neptunius TaxID=1938619 RepID=A0A5C5WH09_9PLAN|nr:class I SAM-dependent rRNA methyltransferase [Thalassoglobus neptunius]TWT49940.1 Ribosomal RNA large subunit methyltransferase I [Thalassoglobus neptunius]